MQWKVTRRSRPRRAALARAISRASARNFSGVNFGLRQLGGERQGNTAGAGADVDDAWNTPTLSQETRPRQEWATQVAAEVEHSLHQVLGFRTRDEDSRADDEVQPPEFLVPGDVLRGNAASALLEGFLVAGLFVGGKFALGMGVEIGAIAAEDEHEQDFGVHAGGADMVLLEQGDGVAQGLFQLHAGRFNHRGHEGKNWPLINTD